MSKFQCSDGIRDERIMTSKTSGISRSLFLFDAGLLECNLGITVTWKVSDYIVRAMHVMRSVYQDRKLFPRCFGEYCIWKSLHFSGRPWCSFPMQGAGLNLELRIDLKSIQKIWPHNLSISGWFYLHCLPDKMGTPPVWVWVWQFRQKFSHGYKDNRSFRSCQVPMVRFFSVFGQLLHPLPNMNPFLGAYPWGRKWV